MNARPPDLFELLFYKGASLIIRLREPLIITVGGSIGKTMTLEAISAVVHGLRSVRASGKEANTPLDSALAIVGDLGGLTGVFSRVKVLWETLQQIIRRRPYPEILILKYIADQRGDGDALLDLARPKIAVVTTLEEETAAKERGKFVDAVPNTGYAVLNFDDQTARMLRARTRAHVLTFGFDAESDVRIVNFENRSEGKRPKGVSFKLEYGGSFLPVWIEGAFGRPAAYAAAAAAAVGVILGMNLVRIGEALRYFKNPPHRLQPLRGIKNSLLIDDAWSASPRSMEAAMDAVHTFPARRRIGVLGDMLEAGPYSAETYEAIGKLAAETCNLLITVGPRATFIAEGARRHGLRKRNIMRFDSADEAAPVVRGLLQAGDVVLIKASRAMHFEKIVTELVNNSAPIV